MCLNAVNDSGPAYISELLHVYTPSHTLCSSSDTHMKKIQWYKRKTHGFVIFCYFGPHIWNSFPQDLRHCSTLSKPHRKLSSSHSTFAPTNINTQFSLQSLCVYACVCVCVCVCVYRSVSRMYKRSEFTEHRFCFI